MQENSSIETFRISSNKCLRLFVDQYYQKSKLSNNYLKRYVVYDGSLSLSMINYDNEYSELEDNFFCKDKKGKICEKKRVHIKAASAIARHFFVEFL